MDEVLSLALISFVIGASSVKTNDYFIAKNDFLLHKLNSIWNLHRQIWIYNVYKSYVMSAVYKK